MRVNVVSESGLAQGQGVHTVFLLTIEALRRIAELDVTVNARGRADVVHLHTVGPLAWFHLAGRGAARIVVSAHIVPASLVGSLAGSDHWIRLATAYLRWFYNRADLVLAVSPAVRQTLTDIGVVAPVVYLANPVDTRMFRPDAPGADAVRTRLGVAPGTPVVLCAGQVQPRKGVETFLNLARRHPEACFIWAGGRPFGRLTAGYDEINRRLAQADDNVRFVGTVPFGEMAAYYAAADCFVFPSHQENFPLAPIEAAAAGCPLILRDLPEYRPIFGDDYLAAGDDDAFDRHLSAVVHDPANAARQRARALALADRYRLDRYGAALHAHYQSLCDGAR
jgi:1,2-diacylglycerol-3-alpha-glucose alpha-1,2-galactosyltransferase